MKVVTDLVVALSLVMFVAATWSTEAIEVPGSGWWLALTFIGVVLRLACSRFALERLWSTPPADRDADPQTDDFITWAETSFRERNPRKETILDLTGLLIDPSGYFDRIKESIEINPTWYRSTTSLTFKAKSQRTVLVPISAQRKQVLVDGMSVTCNGGPASTLSYIENQGAILNVVASIYERLVPDHAANDDLLYKIKKVVASPRPANADDCASVLAQLSALDLSTVDVPLDEPKALAGKHAAESSTPAAAATLPPGSDVPSADPPIKASKETWRDALINLVDLCAHSYFILCVISPDDKTSVRKITLTTRSRAAVESRGFWATVRSVIGLNEREHHFFLQRALETVSYHFSIECPKGMYLYRTKFSHQDRKNPTESPLPAAPTRRALLPDRIESKSTKLLHVYLRDHLGTQPSEAPSSATSRVECVGISLRERPPGLLEASLLLSAYLVATCWTVGTYHNQIFGTSPPPGTWPTVLFGIPTLLSGWLVSRINVETMRKMSLVSLVMTIWLAINSGVAVFAAAFKSSHAQLTEESANVGFVELEHPAWAALMLIVALHLALNVVFVVGRAGRYWLTLNQVTR